MPNDLTQCIAILKTLYDNLELKRIKLTKVIDLVVWMSKEAQCQKLCLQFMTLSPKHWHQAHPHRLSLLVRHLPLKSHFHFLTNTNARNPWPSSTVKRLSSTPLNYQWRWTAVSTQRRLAALFCMSAPSHGCRGNLPSHLLSPTCTHSLSTTKHWKLVWSGGVE